MQWTRVGTAWVYGDHVVGDDLIGGPEVVNSDIYAPEILAQHLMKGVDPAFVAQAKPGDFIVAGRNFGYSKAHQQVYLAFLGFGIGGVIAESFQPFLRRALPTYGIPYLQCPQVTTKIRTGDRLHVDFLGGEIVIESTGIAVKCEGMPGVLLPYYEAGNHLAYLAQKLGKAYRLTP